MQIFLSRPTWVSSEFEEGLKIFMMNLNNIGMNPRTLGTSDYPSKAPLDEVIEIMRQCEGAIVLGYPQITIDSCKIKSKPVNNLILPTEWNHIEASLAYSMGLPLLLVHHDGVGRGVFDRGVMNAFLHKIDLTKPSWSLAEGFNGALNKWKENCDSGNSNFPSTALLKKDSPICPNCSTTSKPIYMSKLPKGFDDFGKWLCNKCKYMEQ